MNRAEKRSHRGFTLMEMLAIVAILAVLASIVIPSVHYVREFLTYRENSRSAKTVFLAAQANLTHLRSQGRLENWGLPAISQAEDPEGLLPESCRYICGDDEDFSAVLPPLSVEKTLRDGNMVIEFDPVTGNVRAVFYYRGTLTLRQLYEAGQLSRKERTCRAMGLGYYDGSDLGQDRWAVSRVKAEVWVENSQAAVVTVAVPMQTAEGENLLDDRYRDFMAGLEVKLTLTGDRGGSISSVIKSPGSTDNCTLGSIAGGVRAVLIHTTLDSLAPGGGFSTLSSGKLPENTLSEEEFTILPGDNLSIRAEVRFLPEGSDPVILVESGAIAGVNPLFASLTENGSGGYVLEIANGRHLQNLNALTPSVAKDVDTVVFRASGGTEMPGGKVTGGIIDWQETADSYGGDLPFVPIRNPWLFGEVDPTAFPLLKDQGLRTKYAQILGNGVTIANLYTEETAHALPGYTGIQEDGTRFAGVFSYVNGKIDGLYVADPRIRGGRGTSLSAAGGLVGAAGPDARISGCGVYGDSDGTGVSGYGAVGGLIGSIQGDGSQVDAVIRSFAAVPVTAELRRTETSGYTDGVGGLVGNARQVRFQKCYASGAVSGTGCGMAPGGFGIPGFSADGAISCGAGGFAGTAQGVRFANCFASGSVRGEIAGGFIGVMCWDAGTAFYRCYSAGLACQGNEIYENFSGVNALLEAGGIGTDFRANYYEAVIPRYLQSGGLNPAQYVFRDCHYLAGNLPGADYDNRASALCATPETYDTLAALWENPADSLAELKQSQFRDEGELERAKSFLLNLAADPEGLQPVLDRYTGRGSYQIYFDSLPWLDSGQDLARRISARYAAAFPKSIWGEAEGGYPFAMLNGLPYHGAWPEKQPETGDFGVAYYEIYDDGVGLRMVSLRDGTVRTEGLDSGKAAREAGYVLYFPEGSKPFSRETYALAGEPMAFLAEPGLLTAGSRCCKIDAKTEAIDGEPVPLWVSSRDGSREVSLVLSFADTIGQSGGSWKIRSQSQLEETARFPGGDYVVEGLLELEEDYASIEQFFGILTGSADSIIRMKGTACGLIDSLQGVVEHITVEGIARLSGTAGILCHKLSAGGVLRDCRVEAEVTAEQGAGLLVGSAEAGRMEDCHGITENSSIPPVGCAAVTEEGTVENATHMGRTAIGDGIVTSSEVFALSNTVLPRVSYRTAFENCTLTRNGETRSIIQPMYYYRLSPLGGWKITRWEGGDQFAPTQTTYEVLAEGAGEDWKPTAFFLQAGTEILRLYVREEGERTFRFSCLREEKRLESEIVTVTDPGETVTAIPFPDGNYPILSQRQLPDSGKYLLVTEAGLALAAEDGLLSRRSFDTAAPDICWIPGGDGWKNEETGKVLQVSLLPDGPVVENGAAVLAAYQEETTVEVTETGPDGQESVRTETNIQLREELCWLYAVTEQTDCLLERVDSGERLLSAGE